MTKQNKWKQKASRFPGFAECVRMMRKHDVAIQEDGFFALVSHASEFVNELILEFRTERDPGMRFRLLDLIGIAKSEAAFELLAEQLDSQEDALRRLAVRGLQDLDTKAARRLLFERGPFDDLAWFRPPDGRP